MADCHSESMQIVCIKLDSGCIVRLSGTIDEQFPRLQILKTSATVLIFDLSSVRRITSFGVREWRRCLDELSSEYYGFINCRPNLVAQFNMVSRFGGNGQLITLFAPYL